MACFAWLLSFSDVHWDPPCWIIDRCFVTFCGYIVIHISWVDTCIGLTVCIHLVKSFFCLGSYIFWKAEMRVDRAWLQLLTTSVPPFQALLYFFCINLCLHSVINDLISELPYQTPNCIFQFHLFIAGEQSKLGVGLLFDLGGCGRWFKTG